MREIPYFRRQSQFPDLGLTPAAVANMDTVGLDSATLCVLLTPFATGSTTAGYLDSIALTTRNLVWQDSNMIDCGAAGVSDWFNLGSNYVQKAVGGLGPLDTKDGGNSVPKPASTANPLSARRLWLRLHTPNDTSVNSIQKFRLTILAKSASTF